MKQSMTLVMILERKKFTLDKNSIEDVGGDEKKIKNTLKKAP